MSSMRDINMCQSNMTLEAVKRRCAMKCSGYSLGFGRVLWRRALGRERLRSHAARFLAQGHSGSPGDRGKPRQSTAQPIKGCWNQVPFFCRPEPHPPSTGIGRQVADIESQLPGGDACSHRRPGTAAHLPRRSDRLAISGRWLDRGQFQHMAALRYSNSTPERSRI